MPSHFLILGAFAIFVFSGLTLLIMSVVMKPEDEAQRAIEVTVRSAPKATLLSLRKRFLDGIVSVVRSARSLLRLMPNKNSAQRLAMAGYWKPSANDYYFTAQIFFPAAFAWLGSLAHSNTFSWILFSTAIGVFLPGFWLSRAIRRRTAKLRKALPDAVDLLVICVDAGLGLDQAILRVSEELIRSHPELHEELHRVYLEQRTGRPRLEAWQDLAKRTTLPEVASFVSLFVQAERFGTQVTKALSTFADDIRQKQRQRAEEAAAALKVKIIFPLVVLIFPCLIVVLLGPAVLSITHDLQALLK